MAISSRVGCRRSGESMSRQLDPADVEAIAQRVVEMLGDRGAPSQLVSAAELSRRLGLSRSTVYEKAEELGVIRIGNGPRARLRFDPDLVARSLGAGRAAVQASANPRPGAARRRRATRRPPKARVAPDPRRGATMSSAQIAMKRASGLAARSRPAGTLRAHGAEADRRGPRAPPRRDDHLRAPLPRVRQAALSDPRDQGRGLDAGPGRGGAAERPRRRPPRHLAAAAAVGRRRRTSRPSTSSPPSGSRRCSTKGCARTRSSTTSGS